MGVPWAVAPARTAWFYIVNAWLREYVAVLTYRRRPALACAAVARGLRRAVRAAGPRRADGAYRLREAAFPAQEFQNDCS